MNDPRQISLAIVDGDLPGVQATLKDPKSFGQPLPNSMLTPVMLASAHGHVEMLRWMLDTSEDPAQLIAQMTEQAESALSLAAESGHVDVIRTLLKYPSALSSVDTAFLPPTAATADTLLEHGAPIDTPFLYGRTALMIAAKEGREAAVDALIEAGADIHLGDQDDLTALHYAIGSDNAAIIRSLLRAGADTEVIDSNGHGAWLYAAECCALESLKTLASHGVNIHATTHAWASLRHNALMLACGNEMAPGENVAEVVRWLLDLGMPIDEQDNEGSAALMIAVRSFNVEAARTLLEKGAAMTPNHKGETPLMAACDGCNPDMVALLLEYGADVMAVDHQGNHALLHLGTWQYFHPEVNEQRLRCFELLLRAGADLHAANHAGNTPFIRFAEHGDAALVREMLQYPVDIDAVDGMGQSAESQAEAVGFHEVVDLIRAERARRALAMDETPCAHDS